MFVVRVTPHLVGMKRLDLHGNVVAGSPHTMRTCASSRDEAHTGGPAAMDTIGIDRHKRESQLCIIGEDGAVRERRIVTSRERFTAVLGDRVGARALVEASTESEWVARHLESLGLTVIVADPNYAPDCWRCTAWYSRGVACRGTSPRSSARGTAARFPRRWTRASVGSGGG
jgi:hypothetical protein